MNFFKDDIPAKIFQCVSQLSSKGLIIDNSDGLVPTSSSASRSRLLTASSGMGEGFGRLTVRKLEA